MKKLVLATTNLVFCKREKEIFPCPPNAPYFDCGDIIDSIVEIYHGTPEGLEETCATQLIYSDLNGAIAVGDINADSYMDLAVGRYNEVDIYIGTAAGMNISVSQFLTGDSRFGGAIYFSDFNADGYSDSAVVPLVQISGKI